MKKYLMTLCLTVLFTNSVNAFTYRCIESGMTKDEYHEAWNTSLISQNNGDSREYLETKLWSNRDLSGTPLEGMNPGIELYWTEDNLLWKINFTYYAGKGAIRAAAMQDLLNKEYPGLDIQKKTNEYGNSFFYVVLSDEEILNLALKKIQEEMQSSL